MKISKKLIIIIMAGAFLLGTGIVLTACKSKKKSNSNDDQNIYTIAAPQYAELKTPLVDSSFSNNPTFTVRQVEEGDTIRLYKDPSCSAGSLLGSGVVAEGQTQVDIAVAALPSYGTYQIYANRTNTSGETSRCSLRLTSYQYIGCPGEFYVHVQGNPDLGTTDFCMMKTEAKNNGNDIPVSQYEGLPWTSIAPGDAKAACKSIPLEHGSCDLISNPQWMTAAREMEAMDENWGNGTIGDGFLKAGHSDGDPDNLLSISDSNDPLDQTNSDEGNWLQQRTNVLSSGEVVWDFAGNADEWADWETGGDTFTVGPNTCPKTGPPARIHAVDCPALTENDYFPGNPAGISRDNYWIQHPGCFQGTSDDLRQQGSGGAARRGGHFELGSNYSGLFYLSLGNGPTHVNPVVGFRCVCVVTGE